MDPRLAKKVASKVDEILKENSFYAPVLEIYNKISKEIGDHLEGKKKGYKLEAY